MSDFKAVTDSAHAIKQVQNFFEKRYFLLTAGNFATGEFNAMAISWGFVGAVWGRPAVMVMARPQRFTKVFLDQFPDFTLSMMPESMRKGVMLCGSISGRTHPDKLKSANFTPVAIENCAAPAMAEAEMVVACRRMYKQDMAGGNVTPELAAEWYPQRDFHTLYFGEIITIFEK